MTLLRAGYFPPSVTTFNAHAIHGKHWGDPSPAEFNLVYQSLYPITDPEVIANGANFHHLEAYKPIDMESIGFKHDEKSQLWKTSTGDQDFVMK